MSRQFLTPPGLPSGASVPSTGTAGALFFNTSDSLVYVHDGTSWSPVVGDGMPAGGADGQILAKASATDYDTEWIDNYATQIKHEVKLAESISKGQAVYISSANGTNMIVSKASNATEGTSSKTLGLLETGGATNDIVKVVTSGLLAGLNTDGTTAGDPVWLGTSGNLIFGLASKPVAPSHMVYLGVVTRSNLSNGEIFVHVQNGFELNELHNVLLEADASTADNEVLAYDSASSLWKNQTAAEAGLSVVGHTHAIANVADLQTTLDAKANLAGASFTGSVSTTGDLTASGFLKSTNSQGDEGGQIDLTKAATNTTLTTGVTLDVFQNKLRIFETGGSNRGYYLDISAGGNSVGTNLVSAGGGATGTVTSISTTSPITGGTITSSGTIGINASSSNTASYVVQRDASGNFAAGTITAAFSGSGAALTSLPAANVTGTLTSTVLGNSTAYVGTTAVPLNRSSANQALTGISSVAFPGSTSGTATLQASAAAGTPTLTLPATTGTLALTSDLPTVNDATLTLAVSGTGLSGSQTFTANQGSNATFTVTSNANSANGASTIVARDTSGNFAANVVTATTFSGSGSGLTSIPTANLSGSVTNLQLQNSSVALGDQTLSLGGTATTTLSGLTTVSAGAFTSTITTGTAPFTVASTTLVANLNADLLEGYSPAATNTANTVVLRDANGSFAANVITANIALANVTGLGANVATFLATPTSTNLANAVTGETGSGALVFRGSTIASTSDTAVGWYTIAYGSNTRASAKFIVTDTRTGVHQVVSFHASNLFHLDTAAGITVLHQAAYSTAGAPIQKLRIKNGSVSTDGFVLQVYVDAATNSLAAYMYENDLPSGWTLPTNWVPDASDPGVTAYANAVSVVEVNLDVGGAGLNQMLVTGDVYAGANAAFKVYTTNDASSTNTPSKVVVRDAGGSFAANLITTNLLNQVSLTSAGGIANVVLASSSTLTTSGSFSTTITSTANTSVTLPTSGTLATTAQVPAAKNMTGYYYGPDGILTTTSGSLTANTMFAVPIFIPETKTFTRIGVNVTGLGGAITAVFRLGIYDNSATENYPASRVLDAGAITVAPGEAGGVQAITISQSLTPGLYWLVAALQGGSTAPAATMSRQSTGGSSFLPISTVASPSATTRAYAWTQSSVTGAFPSTWTTTKTFSTGIAPFVMLGIA